jgi:hypothetical protein
MVFENIDATGAHILWHNYSVMVWWLPCTVSPLTFSPFFFFFFLFFYFSRCGFYVFQISLYCHPIYDLSWDMCTSMVLSSSSLKSQTDFVIPNLAFASPGRIPSFVDSLSENMLKFLFLDHTCHIHICGSSCIKNRNLLILISSSQEILVVKYSCLHYDDIWMTLYA